MINHDENPFFEAYAGISDDDVLDARRESESYNESALGVATPESTVIDAPWPDLISKNAYDLIVRWETGGRAYYEQVIRSAPTWPGYASGITIGCGFDLGYHTVSEFRSAWAGRLGQASIDRLLPAIGFKTVEPDRAAKVVKAKKFVTLVADIKISWDVALQQFDESKVPVLTRQLYGALDHLDWLHPHSRGALLSLVFNRGNSFGAGGDRFREMRDIRERCRVGDAAAFASIPALIRSMKRIWGKGSSLSKRRETEAVLFEVGLAEQAAASALHS